MTWTGVWTNTTLQLSDVARAKWRSSTRSLGLELKEGKKTIGFGAYRRDHRPELVRFFRERIDPGLQSGWDDVWERYASPEVQARTLRENVTTFHRLLRVLLLGPLLGFLVGLVLSLTATGLPTWTGSLALDWTVRGSLVSLELAAMLWVLNWIHEPEAASASDVS